MEAMLGSCNAIQIKAASLGTVAKQYSGNIRVYIFLVLLISRWLKKGLDIDT